MFQEELELSGQTFLRVRRGGGVAVFPVGRRRLGVLLCSLGSGAVHDGDLDWEQQLRHTVCTALTSY